MDPFQLPFEGLLATAFGAFFRGQALALLLQPGGIIALPGDTIAAIQLEDPLGHVIQEIAIVGYRNDGAFVLLQVTLQPGDRFGIQVVGRLVEQQDIRFGQQQPAERDPAALATRKNAHRRLAWRATQRIEGDLQAIVQGPGLDPVKLVLQAGLLFDQGVEICIRVGKGIIDCLITLEQVKDRLDSFFNHLADGLIRVELGLLVEHTNAVALGKGDLPGVAVVLAGDNPQQGTFPRAIQPKNTNLGAIEKAQRDIPQDLLVGGREDSANPDHRKNYLFIIHKIFRFKYFCGL